MLDRVVAMLWRLTHPLPAFPKPVSGTLARGKEAGRKGKQVARKRKQVARKRKQVARKGKQVARKGKSLGQPA